MNISNYTRLLALAALTSLMVGCASNPNIEKSKASAVFPHPLAKVQKGAVDALAVTGFDVQKQEPAYVQGRRPRKVGFFVGSGGETVGVWLKEPAANKTEAKVATATTFAGRAGQKNWDKEVLAEISKALGE